MCVLTFIHYKDKKFFFEDERKKKSLSIFIHIAERV